MEKEEIKTIQALAIILIWTLVALLIGIWFGSNWWPNQKWSKEKSREYEIFCEQMGGEILFTRSNEYPVCETKTRKLIYINEEEAKCKTNGGRFQVRLKGETFEQYYECVKPEEVLYQID